MAKTDYKSIDEYIDAQPEEDRVVLQKLRNSIKKAVPEAEEVISYQIPAFKHHGFVIYFSCYTNHYSISFPPPWTVFDKFKKELSKYKMSKSTVQFPKDQSFPYDLVGKMAKFRANENEVSKK